jgi:hypothetical protein
MNKLPWLLAIVLVVGVAAVILWPRTEPPPPPPVQVEEAPVEEEEPEVFEPPPPPPMAVEPETPVAPLPSLEESDDEVRQSVVDLVGQEPVETYLVPSSIVRKIVVTVDNLPRDKVAMRLRAVQDLPGRFVASGTEDSPVLDGANFIRYRTFAAVVEAVETEQAIAAYRRLYPLFQEAYRELGYPDKAFHSRVIECIDDMLEAPEVRAGTRLVRPKVLYEYADPALESRSAGQKMLMRMGPDNAARVKAKLREIRTQLVEQSRAGWPEA